MIDVFDIIGPIMIGPSSSHTAGAVRLGRLARAIFGTIPEKVEMYLHGSFAKTYKGHGTDVALIAGILGMEADDQRIPNALNIAQEQNIQVKYIPTDLGNVHPNTVMFVMYKGNTKRVVRGASIGGGNVVVNRIDDFNVNLHGDYHALIIKYQDKPGMIAKVSEILAEEKINIAEMRVSRVEKGATALMVVEVDTEVNPASLSKINTIAGVNRSMYIKPI